MRSNSMVDGSATLSEQSSVWQQVLALDAKYNNFRAPAHPTHRRFYWIIAIICVSNVLECVIMHRHALHSPTLLPSPRECKATPGRPKRTCREARVRAPARADPRRAVRRGGRRRHRADEHGGALGVARRQPADAQRQQREPRRARSSFEGSPFEIRPHAQGTSSAAIVPTIVADASRALVGDTTIAQHYSFSGMQHVFDCWLFIDSYYESLSRWPNIFSPAHGRHQPAALRPRRPVPFRGEQS